ncbi:MAG: hypothetical protein L0387_04010 [Acidobacteria bacterium]|nr:hypothetical protein [Acidobacteriota bacterium]MCI0721772.1 hypothetical protein [Acidobacteriota bacterium]
MALSEAARRWVLWAGVVAVILALRVGCVLYERSRPFPQRPAVARPIDRDRLVVIPKFYVEDFASAQQLAGKRVWVKLGYSTSYFLDKPRLKPADRELRQFQPLESFAIENVVERPVAGEAGNREVLLHFRREGQSWLTLAGLYDAQAERYEMQLDELFYLKDPRELYAHWDEDAWSKIEKHSLEPGMTLAQAVFSMGYGRLVTMEAGGIQLYEFTRGPGGQPGKTRIRFLDGRVKEFEVR